MESINNGHNQILIDWFERRKSNRLGNTIVWCCSIILAVGCCIVVAIVQYTNFDKFVKSLVANTTDEFIHSLDGVANTCNTLYYLNIDIIQFSLAVCLLFFYILLFKRRSFLVKKFRNRHFGLVSLFKRKTSTFLFLYPFFFFDSLPL